MTMKPSDPRRSLRSFIAAPVALAVLFALLPLGCVSKSTVQANSSASVGQQLQDLDKSYKDGIITQKEYERLKKALIKQND
jgi:hypothetical protein